MDESEPAVNTTAEGWFHWCVAIYHRIVPGSFPNPAVSFGVCYSAVDAAAGGLTTGWWDVVLECFSSHPLRVSKALALIRYRALTWYRVP